MWNFYIICLQIMITIAWNESGALSDIFQFQNILRTFIMFAALDFAQAIFDIYLSWKERHRMSTNVIVKYILMAVIGLALVLGLTQLSGYPLIVAQLYIGNDMRENTSLVKYRMLSWIVLLIPKFAFSYYVEILPLIGPTKEIMLLNISVDRLPELFPPVVNKIALVFSLWSPTILIYFMDTLVWYATLSTLVGGMSGVLIRLGEVQTLGMLRTKFCFLPNAYKDCLVPIDATQSVNALFNLMWNTIVASFREEILINNWELELMLMSFGKTLDAAKNEKLPPIRWPIYLVANKIPMALAMAKANQNKLQGKLYADTDIYMSAAIQECYVFFQMILRSLGTCFIKGFQEDPELV